MPSRSRTTLPNQPSTKIADSARAVSPVDAASPAEDAAVAVPQVLMMMIMVTILRGDGADLGADRGVDMEDTVVEMEDTVDMEDTDHTLAPAQVITHIPPVTGCTTRHQAAVPLPQAATVARAASPDPAVDPREARAADAASLAEDAAAVRATAVTPMATDTDTTANTDTDTNLTAPTAAPTVPNQAARDARAV